MDITDAGAVKERLGVPPALASCHTALIDGYVIEGHAPVREIARLVREKPFAAGIAVPGMPAGSPGMERTRAEPYQVMLFDYRGKTTVFASYA